MGSSRTCNARGSASRKDTTSSISSLALRRELPADVLKRRTRSKHRGGCRQRSDERSSDIERARYVPIPREKMTGALEASTHGCTGSLALLWSPCSRRAGSAPRFGSHARARASSVTSAAARLGKQVAERADGEVETAIRAFNQMSQRLASLDEEARTLREREPPRARSASSLAVSLTACGILCTAWALRRELAASPRRGARPRDGRRREDADPAHRSRAAFVPRALGYRHGDCEEVLARDLARDVALEATQECDPARASSWSRT
jgi:hypothetical protein